MTDKVYKDDSDDNGNFDLNFLSKEDQEAIKTGEKGFRLRVPIRKQMIKELEGSLDEVRYQRSMVKKFIHIMETRIDPIEGPSSKELELVLFPEDVKTDNTTGNEVPNSNADRKFRRLINEVNKSPLNITSTYYSGIVKDEKRSSEGTIHALGIYVRVSEKVAFQPIGRFELQIAAFQNRIAKIKQTSNVTKEDIQAIIQNRLARKEKQQTLNTLIEELKIQEATINEGLISLKRIKDEIKRLKDELGE